MASTSFVLTEADRLTLDQLKDRTGVSKTVIVRRLLAAYADGLVVPGLPTVVPPIRQRGRG